MLQLIKSHICLTPNQSQNRNVPFQLLGKQRLLGVSSLSKAISQKSSSRAWNSQPSDPKSGTLTTRPRTHPISFRDDCCCIYFQSNQSIHDEIEKIRAEVRKSHGFVVHPQPIQLDPYMACIAFHDIFFKVADAKQFLEGIIQKLGLYARYFPWLDGRVHMFSELSNLFCEWLVYQKKKFPIQL